MAEPLIFWTDGSCFEHCAVAGIAVVDKKAAALVSARFAPPFTAPIET